MHIICSTFFFSNPSNIALAAKVQKGSKKEKLNIKTYGRMGELWLTKVTYWKELDNLDNDSLGLSLIQVI